MPRPDVASAIARCELFSSLSPAECDDLASQSAIRRYEKDHQLFARGDVGDSLYIVLAGSIALTASNAAGREVVLAISTPPQSFGELAVLDQGPRVATATARERSVLISVPGGAVRNLFVTHPSIAQALMNSLSRMTRQVHDHSLDLVTIDLPGRVAKFLLGEANPSPAQLAARRQVAVNLTLNQTELAQRVGGSRQHVNRVILALESAGAITRRGTRIVAVRPDLLAMAADDGVR
jgi:CRP-like cAMP-binding protein